MLDTVLALLMLAGLALLWGAWTLWRRGGSRQKAWLMLGAALVLFANVAIWTIPTDNGDSPAEALAKGGE